MTSKIRPQMANRSVDSAPPTAGSVVLNTEVPEPTTYYGTNICRLPRTDEAPAQPLT